MHLEGGYLAAVSGPQQPVSTPACGSVLQAYIHTYMHTLALSVGVRSVLIPDVFIWGGGRDNLCFVLLAHVFREGCLAGLHSE